MEVIHAISKYLTHVCNMSFKTGVFPTRRKITSMIPVYKNGPKADLTNDRPIYIFPRLSNIFERHILAKTDFKYQLHFKFESFRVSC